MRTGKKDTGIFGVPDFVHSGGDMRTLVPPYKGWKRLTAAVCAGLMAGAFSFLPVAEARGGELLPQGGVSSTASIVTDSGTMNITGAANNVIKWVSFSIGQGNAVKFDNNNYLNYVTGHARSEILGTLTGGGNIYLVNPNGILIGDNARIDVGNLYLSTRNLTADQLTDYATATGALFKAGDLNGDVINMGKLNADVITVEGNNITFKNVADVTKGGKLENGNITGGTLNNAVTLTANGGEIHLGYENGDADTAVNNDQYKTVNTPTLNGWNFGGKTPAYYMLVRNKYELQNMQNNLSGNYMLAGDIDMNGFSFTPIGTVGETYYEVNGFHGRFDGLGYKIQNLNVESDAMGVGLFGFVGSMVRNESHGPEPVDPENEFTYEQGIVENVNLVNANVKGTVSDGDCYVGGVAGNLLKGSILRNVSYGGTVESSRSSVGGIVGLNNGTIERAYNTGTVQGLSDTGGIVGYCSAGTISQVYNEGAVNGNAQVGGIVGFLQGNAKVENAYNTGNVTGTNWWVGGIVGNMFGTVENVYNTGNVSGLQFVGGIAGAYQDGTLAHAYSKSGVASGTTDVNDTVGGGNYSGGTAIAEADLKNPTSYTGFDFSEGGAWRIYEGNTMPLLTAFMKKKDNIVSIEYDETGTGDIGARYVETTYNGIEAQVGGANYISDVYVTLPVQSAPSNPEGGGSSGGSGGSGGSGTPTSLVNPSNPVAPVTPVNPVEPTPVIPAEPTPVNPAEPSSAAPGQAVTNPASGALRPEGTLAERVIAEVEAGNLSLGTVTELENAAETAKEQPFAKDRAAMAEMGAVEATAPAPAPSDSGHSYTMLDGGLVAVRDDVNSAPASAAMGGKSNNNANEVIEAAEQADLTIGTEEVHNRQDNSTSDEDSDEQEKKNNKSNQDTKKAETAKEATDK